MGFFDNLDTAAATDVGDRPIGNFDAIESGVYDAIVKVAYAGVSAKGSKNFTVIFDIDGRELKETFYYTNTEGKVAFPDKKDPKKTTVMGGYVILNELAQLITGHELKMQPTEEKIVKVYDPAQRKEAPTPVQVLSEITGKAIKIGVIRKIVNKQAKNDAGDYVDTAETRTQNEVSKVFHAETGRTVTEYKQEIPTAEYLAGWEKANAGKDRNQVKQVGLGGAIGASGTGRPGAAGGASKAATSLFG